MAGRPAAGTAPAYPTRPKVYAAKFVRRLTKEALANVLGTDVCWLLTVIAMQEDASGYRRAVNFFNPQLMQLCGFVTEDTLSRVRAKAVAAGWLHYVPGRRGVPAQYWVLIPTVAAGMDDAPTDEPATEPLPTESQDADWGVQNRTDPRPVSVQFASSDRPASGQSASSVRPVCGTSFPVPDPDPVPVPVPKDPPTPLGGVEAGAYPSSPADGTEDDPGPERSSGRGANRRAPPADPPPDFDPDALVVKPEPFDALLVAWAAAGLKGGGKLQRTSEREGHWQRRWRDEPAFRSGWREAVARAGRSAKLSGRLAGWRSPLQMDDFLRDVYLGVGNLFVRLTVEGEFDDGPARPREPPGRESAADREQRLRERMTRPQG